MDYSQKRSIKIFSLLVCLVCISSLLGWITPKTTLALTASPVRLELSGNPGSSVNGEFELHNESRQTKRYIVNFADFESGGEDGQPKFVSSKDGLSSWISLNDLDKEIEIAPLGRKKIRFTVNVPSQVEPGGYFSAALAKDGAGETSGKEGEVSINGEVGTLLLFQVNGEMREGADILEFKTKNGQKIFNHLPVDFYFRFQNEGTSWVKPLGDIVIKNWFGGTSQIFSANSGGGNVLPRSIRRFESSWLTQKGEVQDKNQPRPENFPNGFWNRIKYQVRHFALGRYTANLTLTYGDTSPKQTSAKVAFWILPWELLIFSLVSLVVILGTLTLLAIWIALKILKRRAKKQ